MLRRLLALTLTATAGIAAAVEPGTVYSPRVEEGEIEVEYKAFVFIDRAHDDHREQNHRFGVGYGVNSFWATEIAGEYEWRPDAGGHLEAIEWENRFQFTETGRYWLDAGAIVEYEKARRGSGRAWKIGLLLEKEIEDATLTLDWFHVRESTGEEDDHPAWRPQYRAQLAWRCRPEFWPMMQVQADEHSWIAGPGAIAHFRVGGKEISGTATWLIRGAGDMPRNTIRVEIEVEI